MQRIRRAFLALRENREKGVSLIVALCAVAVLLGLSLSLVYSASLPMARANRKIDRERCYQLAQSFAQVLDGELRAYTTENDKLGTTANPYGDTNTFYHYVNNVLESDAYNEFDKNDPLNTTFYLTTQEATDTEGYGHEVIGLRKEVTRNVVNDGSFDYDESAEGTEKAEHATFIQYRLTVLVQASLHNDSYTYTTEYYRKDGFQPVYQWDGDDTHYPRVYWDGGNWYTTSNFDPSSLVTPKVTVNEEDDTTTTESVRISYTYDQSNITYKIYQPTYQNNNSGGGTDGETPETAEESAG